MNLKLLLLVVIILLPLQVNLVEAEPVTLKTILEIEKSQIGKWWRVMTPIEKHNFHLRLKQGNRIQTLSKKEYYKIENERLLEWVEYRKTTDGDF